MTIGEGLLPVGTSYAEVYARFRWHIPATLRSQRAERRRRGRHAPWFRDPLGPWPRAP